MGRMTRMTRSIDDEERSDGGRVTGGRRGSNGTFELARGQRGDSIASKGGGWIMGMYFVL